MKLFPPQDTCTIYKTGFGTDDILGRAETGKRLSDLLERIEDPVVVALDGRWGSGKSHFLKRWVGAHTLENDGRATVVYFDAFANDFLDDPLIGLTGAIAERLSERKAKWTEKVKSAAFDMARPMTRIGAAIATAGATEWAGAVLAELIKAGHKEAEAAAEAFWRREDGRKAAMQQFHDSLMQLTAASAEDEGEGDGKPLIVVIDELDRCRPDYALAMLETVKHFFAVPRVHFVLGVNLEALEHMVRARYGAGIDAGDYLKRFISLTMHLPEEVAGPQPVNAAIRYIKVTSQRMGIARELCEIINQHIRLLTRTTTISLRDVEKILTRLVLLPRPKQLERFTEAQLHLIVSLVLFQVRRPDLYQAAMSRKLEVSDIGTFYDINPEMGFVELAIHDHTAFSVYLTWQVILTDGAELEGRSELIARDLCGLSNHPNPDEIRAILPRIKRDYFDTFTLPD